ncbi:hypothetical protein [Paenibacillus sp. JDR-2]|uniref:hypothetical protein n=1 Tax=Paenibacillus sp. (strain JDR-2) TaxID=324057 RepID=UPI000166462A|nr:hypothetical protein [Paenibacillus sp. JDR-2]ACT01051.1 hypothetical protein Pjdr2_2396 [Paenibacillus sp. JDR-2]
MNKDITIENALAAIVRLLEGAHADWVLGGSAGLMLRGLPLQDKPNDIDLYADDEDYDLIYERLKPYASDTKELSECGNYRSILSHFVIEGVPVELVGGFVVRAERSRYITEVRKLLKPYSEQFVVRNGQEEQHVPVVPLAHELWFNRLRQREDRLQMIVDHYIKEESRHEAARLLLEQRNVFTIEARKQMNQRLSGKQAGAAK